MPCLPRVIVAVVEIRIMRVAMGEPPMDMRVDMGFAGRIVRAVAMLVMLVMAMRVHMVERLVDMVMVVPLDQMEP